MCMHCGGAEYMYIYKRLRIQHVLLSLYRDFYTSLSICIGVHVAEYNKRVLYKGC